MDFGLYYVSRCRLLQTTTSVNLELITAASRETVTTSKDRFDAFRAPVLVVIVSTLAPETATRSTVHEDGEQTTPATVLVSSR